MTSPKVESERPPTPGDIVEVLVRGPFSDDFRTDRPDGHLWIGEKGTRSGLAAAHVVSVEVLPPPEPDWQIGDVVTVECLGDLSTMIHNGSEFRSPGNSKMRPCATCNLTLVVRDGQPVGAA